jgi:hypothetical protein
MLPPGFQSRDFFDHFYLLYTEQNCQLSNHPQITPSLHPKHTLVVFRSSLEADLHCMESSKQKQLSQKPSPFPVSD